MIKSFLDKNFPALFMGLVCVVLAIAIGVPRAASFAAPVAGLILLITYTIGKGKFLSLRKSELFFICAIPALAALSSLWAIDPPFAIERAVKMAPVFIFGLFFIQAARQITPADIPARFVTALCLLYTLGSTLVALELLWDFKLYRFINDLPPEHVVYDVFMNRSIVVMAALFLPIIYLLRGTQLPTRHKQIIGALVTASLLFALALTESQSAQLFFVFSLFFLLAWPARCKMTWIVLGAAIIALAFAAPWFAKTIYGLFPYEDETMLQNPIMVAGSIPHRMEIWNFIATEALKSPLYGQGIEATRYIHSETWLKLPNTDNMLHPHNAVLQIWVEFGLVGVMLATALFIYLLRTIWQAPVRARRTMLAVTMGMLAVMSTGYGLWQSWQLGLIMTMAGFAVFAARADNHVSES